MSTSTQLTRPPLYKRDFKLKNNDRLLAKTGGGNWFHIKRVGERSWEANCVAQATDEWYTEGDIHTITGNSSNLIKKIDDAVVINGLYYIYNQKEYRIAMMSIMATGTINAHINVDKE